MKLNKIFGFIIVFLVVKVIMFAADREKTSNFGGIAPASQKVDARVAIPVEIYHNEQYGISFVKTENWKDTVSRFMNTNGPNCEYLAIFRPYNGRGESTIYFEKLNYDFRNFSVEKWLSDLGKIGCKISLISQEKRIVNGSSAYWAVLLDSGKNVFNCETLIFGKDNQTFALFLASTPLNHEFDQRRFKEVVDSLEVK